MTLFDGRRSAVPSLIHRPVTAAAAERQGIDDADASNAGNLRSGIDHAPLNGQGGLVRVSRHVHVSIGNHHTLRDEAEWRVERAVQPANGDQ